MIPPRSQQKWLDRLHREFEIYATEEIPQISDVEMMMMMMSVYESSSLFFREKKNLVCKQREREFNAKRYMLCL